MDTFKPNLLDLPPEMPYTLQVQPIDLAKLISNQFDRISNIETIIARTNIKSNKIVRLYAIQDNESIFGQLELLHKKNYEVGFSVYVMSNSTYLELFLKLQKESRNIFRDTQISLQEANEIIYKEVRYVYLK